MKKLLFAASAAIIALAAPAQTSNDMQNNPLLQPYNTKYEIPPFNKIKNEHYMPALKAGIARHNAEIEAIVNNPEAPTFENTILAYDRAGADLEKVLMVYFALSESNSSPELQAVAEEFEPLVAAHYDEVSMNPGLFKRVKALYDNRDKLNLATDQKLLVEKMYKGFTRNGALLGDADQQKLKELNNKLTNLYLTFNKTLLAATNEFTIVVDNVSDLEGLPQSNIDVAADEARARGLEGKYVLTLHAPSRLPVLQDL